MIVTGWSQEISLVIVTGDFQVKVTLVIVTGDFQVKVTCE